jgi:zinc transport system ATP-binding protein
VSDFAIEAKDLSVSFGDLSILHQLNWQLDRGCFLSIIGPNGAGKSTLLKVLMGLVKASSGEIRIFGQLPGKLKPGTLGYVPQVKLLERSFPALVEEVVLTGLKRKWPGLCLSKDKDAARSALTQLGAEHLMGRSVRELSGGELQRVYLARVMIARPQLVVLDEPATGIDAGGEADMYELLETYQHQSGATIVMITHDLNATYHLSSRVLLIQREQIGFGGPADVLTDENLRRAFGHVGHDHGMLVAEKHHHD